MTNFNTLPKIDAYIWRQPIPTDAVGLASLEAACAIVDGNKSMTDEEGWQKRLADARLREKDAIVLAATEPNSFPPILAAGHLLYQEEAHEIQGFLDGWVHPRCRNRQIGNALLPWLALRSAANMSARLHELGTPNLPRIGRILIYHQAPWAIRLYKHHGYARQNAEDELHYDLALQPTADLPAELSVETHSADNALDFHAAYLDAFSTRTDNLWNEESWRHHFADPKDGEFQPSMSLLAKVNGEVVGFAVCHADDESAIDVTQMGVGVQFRRRGYASAILAETLRHCAATGYTLATISVNANNPNARQVYEQVGFVLHERYTVFRKAIDEAPEMMAG